MNETLIFYLTRRLILSNFFHFVIFALAFMFSLNEQISLEFLTSRIQFFTHHICFCTVTVKILIHNNNCNSLLFFSIEWFWSLISLFNTFSNDWRIMSSVIFLIIRSRIVRFLFFRIQFVVMNLKCNCDISTIYRIIFESAWNVWVKKKKRISDRIISTCKRHNDDRRIDLTSKSQNWIELTKIEASYSLQSLLWMWWEFPLLQYKNRCGVWKIESLAPRILKVFEYLEIFIFPMVLSHQLSLRLQTKPERLILCTMKALVLVELEAVQLEFFLVTLAFGNSAS